MQRWLKRAGIGLGVLLLLGLGLFAVAWAHSERTLSRTHVVADPPLAVGSDPETVARGRHLYVSRGCASCHGDSAEGKVLFDAGPVARVVPPNLTWTAADPAWTDDAIAAAIRHGVRPDGTPLVFMPVGDYRDLDDADTAAIIAWLRTLRRSRNDPGRTEVRPLGRVLSLFGQFPLAPAEAIDHAPRARRAPLAAATPEYGAYLAQVCTGCHGPGFQGGLVVGAGTPPSANLTPHPDALGHWDRDDFVRAMRNGVRPDGRELHPIMPWREFGTMSDTELDALWAHFGTLPATAPRQ